VKKYFVSYVNHVRGYVEHADHIKDGYITINGKMDNKKTIEQARKYIAKKLCNDQHTGNITILNWKEIDKE
jgi:hypothetical protein